MAEPANQCGENKRSHNHKLFFARGHAECEHEGRKKHFRVLVTGADIQFRREKELEMRSAVGKHLLQSARLIELLLRPRCGPGNERICDYDLTDRLDQQFGDDAKNTPS